MKGDFSRETFDRKKHYSGVLMQQGRVQVDADWNEQGAIARYLAETEGTDVIGECGAPIGNAGFQITTDGQDLTIGAGRYYVDGILVENDLGKITFDEQPKAHFPGASLKAELASFADANRSLAVVYLDVWRRHVTALDDRLLREVALGGPDTTTRMQTVWQVRLLPVAFAGPGGGQIDELDRLNRDLEAQLAKADQDLVVFAANIAQRVAELATIPADGRARARLVASIAKLQVDRAAAEIARTAVAAQFAETRAKLLELRAAGAVSCSTNFPEWDALHVAGAKLNARAKPGDPADDPCELPPGAGYTRLENQLYRVEVHKPGALGTATFKWSRDNGTVVTNIEKISGSHVFVNDLGPDQVLGFANGAWVEISDDSLELNGLPGQLARIIDVKPATRELVLDPAPVALAAGPDGVDKALHPRLRRWDQGSLGPGAGTVNGINTSANWLPIEDGVEVEFSGGPFRTGDYWLIPARTATGDLEWPPFEVPNVSPEGQPRRGILHHRCRLAIVELEGEKLKLLADCRELFPPLTGLQSLATPAALHVVATNWENDLPFELEQLTKDGLRIRLDAAPAASSLNNDSLLVTVDIPYQAAGGRALPNALERIILLGKIGMDPADAQTVVWQMNPLTGGTLAPAGGFIAVRAFAAATAALRLNVTLRGHLIWRETESQTFHLDGQAFARPQTDPTTGRVHGALVLPSGDGVRASDFESWFFLSQKQRPPAVDLRLTRLDFLSINTAGGPIMAIDNFPPDPNKAVEIEARAALSQIRATISRAVSPEGQVGFGSPQSASVEQVLARGNLKPFPVEVTVKGDMVSVRMQDPQVLPVGNWRLSIHSFGTNSALGIRAADDDAPLDGASDGTAANFVLPFAVVQRP